ncbi:MAG TPA: hypothetical protein VGM90_40385 [Kofleriaceae bacterium]|jgi:hypothetical protein
MLRHLAIASLLVVAACDKKPAGTNGTGSGTTGPGASPTAPVTPPKNADAGSIAPVITNSVAFVVPKAAAWWGEFNFACYRGVMALSGGDGVAASADAFNKVSPTVPAAMAAADIDIGRDFQAIGGFDCGGGEPCFYIAAHLAHPEKVKDMFPILLPGVTPKDLGKGHYQVEVPGAAAPRTINLYVLPVQWTTKAPSDPYSQQNQTATHVIFIAGISGVNKDVDVPSMLADATAGTAAVKDIESVLTDSHNRCVLGQTGARDFQPGFKLTKARFAMGVPAAAEADPLMNLVGLKKTLDVQVDLALDPAPKEKDVQGWIADGKAWLGNIGSGVRANFAGQDAMMDVYFDMLSLIGERAFKHEVKGNTLRLSWRTDRIPESDLTALETKLGPLLPQQ